MDTSAPSAVPFRSAGVLMGLIFGAAFSGCASSPDAYPYEESPLEASVIAERAARCDELYRQPRTPSRVARSLELCLRSVSSHDGYSALWRAGRAGAWLAEKHPESEARLRYARIGVALGRAAIADAPGRAESHHFYALNLGLLSGLEGGGLGRLPKMVAAAKRVVTLDERYDHGAGHRFLGILYFETMDNFLAAQGDIDDALAELNRACELFPDYGHNQLALARVLIEDEAFEEARIRLQRAIDSPVPEDETEEHREWIAEAHELLKELEGKAKS